MSLARFLPLEFRRQRLLQRTPSGPLHEYLAVPFADPKKDYRAVTYLALDLETTGTDPRTDHILSIGCVNVHGDRIDLSSAQHRIVSTSKTLTESSVVIHALTDDVIAQGEPISKVLADVLRDLTGKVLLAHHAAIEVGFLRAACQRVFAADFITPVVDTLNLAQRQLRRRDAIVGSHALRLATLREHYHLPRYKAHNALSDAIAAAELFLAQAAERSGGKAGLLLKDVLVRM